LFELVGTLGSDVGSVASALDDINVAGTHNEPRAPSQKESEKVQARHHITEGGDNAEDANDGGEDDDLINYVY
jgi:hypothetical protein